MLQQGLSILDQQFSEELKEIFLLLFTKELIKNSGTKELIALEAVLEEEKVAERKAKKDLKLLEPKEQIKEIVKEKLNPPRHKTEKFSPSMMKTGIRKELPRIAPHRMRRETPPPPRQLRMQKPLISRMHFPEQRLPPRLQYIRPIVTDIQLDLGVLNPLLKDPMVDSIECNGEDENIIIVGRGGIKKTNIILTGEEITHIIRTITDTAKIPFQEGILRIAIGKFTLLAIISDVVSPRFIIKKLPLHPRFPHPGRV